MNWRGTTTIQGQDYDEEDMDNHDDDDTTTIQGQSDEEEDIDNGNDDDTPTTIRW